MKYLIFIFIIAISFLVAFYFYFDKEIDTTNTSISSEIIIENNKNSTKDTLKDNSVKKSLDNNLTELSKNSEKTKETGLISDEPLVNINLLWITNFSLLVAFLSTIVSLYLYYWRYKLIANKEFLIPEKIVSELSSQSNQFNKLSQYNIKVGQLLESQLKKSNSEISELKDILIQFQKTLNEKDDLISRYQQGYDSKVFKNFIGRFYRIYKFLIDLEESKDIQNNDFNKLKTLFDDAFDQSGVEIFYPSIGINYLNEGEMLDDNPVIKLTTNENEDNKVIEVNNPGLRFVEKQINDRVIIKSKVTILQYKESL